MIINLDMTEKMVPIPGEVYGLINAYTYKPVTMEVTYTEPVVEVQQ